jgi:short-subunit dehydrogenase
MELLRHNINVLTVCPGYIATDFVKNMVKGKHAERVGSSVKYGVTPDIVADATLRGLLKRKREVIVPKFYKMIISMYQALPGVVERRIRKSLRPTAQVMAEAAKK